MKLRLHQFLSKTGVFKSKKEIIDAIRNSEVCIEGKTITSPHYQFSASKKVTWKGKEIKPNTNKKYYLLNKPEGYISSRLTKNDTGKKSVFGLLPEDNSLVCAGRLDEVTSGLLIITNDGDLVHKITCPENNIGKTYRVTLEKTEKKYKEIEKGVKIELEENGKISYYRTKPAEIKKISEKEFLITITEGKKREIRRIFEALGNKVSRLERIAIGRLKLEELKIPKGEYLLIEKKEIE